MKRLTLIGGIMLFFATNMNAQKYSLDKKKVLPNDIYSESKRTNNRPISFSSDSLGNKNFADGAINLNDYDYATLTTKADSFFYKKLFIEASKIYAIAFKNNNDRAKVRHRYNLACCYAALSDNDRAFEQLYRIAEKGNYYNYIEIKGEKYFNLLQKDVRWQPLIKIIEDNSRKNQDKLQSQLPKDN